MSERSRVYRKKTVFILIVLCTVNFALFLLSAAPDKEITLTGEALENYISSYPAFLAQTAENSRLLAGLGLNKSRYALDVLQKSAAAYAGLENTVLRADENRGIVLLLQNRISDLFLLAFLMLLAADFLIERQKGLDGMVRSTINGREILYLQRIAILAFSAILGSLLLYGGNFFAMLLRYGRTDLSRCIQSLPEFLKCPYRISIGNYFLISIVLKAVGCFTIAVIFLILISVLKAGPAYFATALLAGLEIMAHTLIAPIASVNLLRYLNLYTILECEEFFTDCCFINLFGKALPAFYSSLVFLGVLLVLSTGCGFFVHGMCYVSHRRFGEHISDRLIAFTERLAPQRSLIRWESYKILIKQRGLVILIAVFAMHFYMSAQYPYLYVMDSHEKLWYDIYKGELTETQLTKAEHQLVILNERIERDEKTLEELLQEIPLNKDRVDAIRASLPEKIAMRDGLIPVLENMRDGMEYTRRTGNTIDLIIPYTYDLLIEKDEQTRERASFFLLIAIIAAVSPIFVFESENHMKDSIHTAYRGRLQTTAIKICTTLGFCVIACLALHLIQIGQISRTLDFNNITSPVQSLPFLREFGPYITIRQYLVLLFAVRSLIACTVGLICLAVSRLCSDTITSLGISAFLFLLPTICAEVFPPDKIVNIIHLLGVSNLS